MSIIKFLEQLPANLYHDVEGIFNKDKAAYNKLAPELKAALKDGSAIWAAISAGLNATQIAQKVGITDAQLLSAEQAIAKAFNVAVADTTDELTTTLANYGNSLAPSVWPAISHAIADIGATVLNGGTPIEIGLSVIKYVYLDLVKPLFIDK